MCHSPLRHQYTIIIIIIIIIIILGYMPLACFRLQENICSIKLLDSICIILPVVIRQWEIEIYVGISVHNVAYTRRSVPWFFESMD
jgi:hypothetical protein